MKIYKDCELTHKPEAKFPENSFDVVCKLTKEEMNTRPFDKGSYGDISIEFIRK